MSSSYLSLQGGPDPKNLLNEVTDGESPDRRGGAGQSRLCRDKRRGEERRGGEGALAGEGGR